MKQAGFLTAAVLLTAVAGCKTTEPEVTAPVSWEQQQVYFRRVSDPRIFGLAIYETPVGPQIRGGARLHPSQTEVLPLLASEPWRPVVNLHGNFGVQWPVLIDPSAPESRLEFGTAAKAGARAVGEQGRVQIVQLPGDEFSSCLSLMPALRLGQLFVDNPLVYVRLAHGPLGPAARGIEDPVVRGVVGWNILKKFEQIQFLYSLGQLVLRTTELYEPNPALLVAELPLVENADVCMVRGTVNGEDGLILIDPAGDFEVAANGTVSSLTIGSNLSVSDPQVSPSPGGVRIGARLLQNYRVTICARAGTVYFETKMSVQK